MLEPGHITPASMDEARKATIAADEGAAALRNVAQPPLSSAQATEFVPLNITSLSGSGSVLAIPTWSNIVSSRTSSSVDVSAATSSSVQTPWAGDGSDLEVLSRLGEDTSSTVFKVRDHRTPSLIMAQKTIFVTNPKALLHSYRKWGGSRHVNITNYYGAFLGTSDGDLPWSNPGPVSARGVCLLMEYCEGGSLDSVSRRIHQMGFGLVSEKVMGKIAHGILLGLDYLHSVKVIHRGEYSFIYSSWSSANLPWNPRRR